MVLGCEFDIQVHLKTRWLNGPLDGRKRMKIIKTAKRGKSHQKKDYLQLWDNYVGALFTFDIKDYCKQKTKIAALLFTCNEVGISQRQMFQGVKVND